jgi:hypothetical protein
MKGYELKRNVDWWLKNSRNIDTNVRVTVNDTEIKLVDKYILSRGKYD